jgi:hypothetical protein
MENFGPHFSDQRNTPLPLLYPSAVAETDARKTRTRQHCAIIQLAESLHSDKREIISSRYDTVMSKAVSRQM